MITLKAHIILLLTFVTLFVGCGPATGPLQFTERVIGAQAQESETNKEKLIAVQKELLESRCASCHGWVSDLEGLLKRITPGKPLESSLYLRVENGSVPLFGASFNEEELELVAQAIEAIKE